MSKRGAISKVEKYKIEQYMQDEMPPQEIADNLDRPLGQIEEHLKKFFMWGKKTDVVVKPNEVAEYLRELRDSTHWQFLREQYDGAELRYYEETYAQMMAQFKEDILPTEQFQILHAIDAQIMINRHKKSRKLIEDQILELSHHIENSKKEAEYDDEVRKDVLQWASERNSLIAQANNRNREFTELSKKFDETVTKLKGTREQRFKNIESSRQSWTALIKSLQDQRVRQKEGRNMELMRIAADKAEEKLRQPHLYINGRVDQPLLQPEHILINNKETGDSIEEGEGNADSEET